MKTSRYEDAAKRMNTFSAPESNIAKFLQHIARVIEVLLLLGVSIISASWVFLLFTIISGVGATRPYFVKIEEAQCLGHYGDAYREYMNRTPRWIGIPKSEKKN
jgi:hypothetical protein